MTSPVTGLASMQGIAAGIAVARRAIEGAVYRTPLEYSAWLSGATGARVSLKLECYQPTGSFKVRGAVAAMRRLEREDTPAIVAASAGNHGLGVAYAVQRAGIAATIVVPETASPAKLAALRRFPVTLLLHGHDYDAAEREAIRLSQRSGDLYLSPYNDREVIAGQGTIGAELLEDEPELDAVVVPVGGGGLIAGVGAWLKAVRPSVRLIGVQPDASPSMLRALEAGKLVQVRVGETLADGLAGNIEPGSITFELARTVMDEMVLVNEREISEAIARMFEEMRVVIEGAAAVGIAALLGGHVTGLAGKSVAIIATGRNIARQQVAELLQ